MITTSPAQRNDLEHGLAHAFVTVNTRSDALMSGGKKMGRSLAGKDTDREIESRRILDRLGREADSSMPPLVSRTTKRARDHLTAADADPTDPVEYWGTRIGRGIGIALTICVIVWLVIFVVRG